MSTFNRISYLVSSHNLPVNSGKVAGDPIFTDNPTAPFNVKAGEIVVFNDKENAVVDVAGVATADNLSVAVGVGDKRGGIAKDLRFLGGRHVNLCDFTMEASATAPSCGSPQEIDVFINGAACGEGHSFILYLDDSFVRSHFETNDRARYIFTSNVACKDCDSCDVTENCDKIVCDLVDQINMRTQTDPSKVSFFQRRDITNYYQPFRAVKIYNQADSLKTFCIDPIADTCESGCLKAQSVLGIDIDGVQTMFTNTVDPSDDTKSYLSQFDAILYEINKVLDPIGGGVYMSKGIDSCCSLTMKVSVCGGKVVKLITSDGAGGTTLVDPCSMENPFTQQVIDDVCRDCSASPETVSFTCGFRVLVDPVSVDCLCDLPPDIVPNYYGRTVDVQPFGDSWSCTQYYIKEVASQTLPEGFGFFWKDKERWQHNGGMGRDFRNGDVYRGKLGYFPTQGSRIMSTTVDCETRYCVYPIVTTVNKVNKFNNALKLYNTDWTYVLIPNGDTSTKTSWEQYLNAFYSRGVCSVENVTCQ